MGYREGSGRPKTCPGYVQWVEELLDKECYSILEIAKITGLTKSVVGRISVAKKRGEHY